MRRDEPAWEPDGTDERIDTALRSYAEPAEIPEARVFLARVMERARSEAPQKPTWWIWGAAAAAGLAVLLAVGVVWMMRSPRRFENAEAPRAPQPAHAGITSPLPMKKPPSIVRAKTRPSRGAAGLRAVRTVAANQPPKLDVFPTPHPLSAQEEALLTFVRRAPPPLRKAVINDQQHWDDPLIVADMQKPLLGSGREKDQ